MFLRTRSNRYDVSFMWFSYGDPDVLRTIFHSENVNAFNRARYQVPEVDSMLEEAAGLTDASKRADIYKQVQLWQSQGQVGRDADPKSFVDLTFVKGHFNVPG